MAATAGVLPASLPVFGADGQDKHISVPAGELNQSLRDLAAQQGVTISADPALTKGLYGNTLDGRYSVAQSLSLLLAGSGLTAIRQENGGYVLQRASAPAAAGSSAAVGDDSTIVVTADADGGIGSHIDEGWAPNANYTVRNSRSAAMLDLSPKHTPQSITTFTSQQIQDQGMLTLAEVMEYTPGMTVVRPGVAGAGNMPVYSRTFPVRSITMDGVIGSTFLLSGQYHGQISMVDPFLYERIDVIRGANGLTSGSGDPSASLAFIRKHPYLERHLTITGKTGSYGLRRTELDFSTPVNDSWRTRFAMAAEGANSWVDRVRHNNLALSWVNDIDLTDSDKLSVGGTYYDFTVHGASPHGLARYSSVYDKRPPEKREPGSDDITEPHMVDTDPSKRNFNNATPWSETNRTYRNLFTTYSHLFDNDWEVKVSYNYADNIDKVMYGEFGSKWYLPDARDTANYQQAYEDRRNMVHTLDVSLRGGFELLEKPQEFVLGYDYFDTKINSYDNLFYDSPDRSDPSATGAYWGWNPRCNRPAFANTTFCKNQKKPSGIKPTQWDNGIYPDKGDKARTGSTSWHQVEQGAYLNTHWQIVPRTHLLLGGRLPLFQRKDNRYAGSTSVQRGNPGGKAYDLHPGFLPYAGLIVDVTDTVSAYYSYTKSFSPDYNHSRNPDTHEPMKAPTYTSNEVGIKGGFFGDRLNLAAAYFDIQQHHFPYVPSTDRTATEGADGYTAHGYELSVAGEITPDWRINAGYVHQVQHFTGNWSDNVITISTGDVTGMYAAPERTVKVFTTYNAAEQVTLGFGWRYQSGTKSTDWDLQQLGTGGSFKNTYEPSYSVYDAMARWNINKNFSAQLNVNNIFDKQYYTHERSYVSGAPRNFMLTFGYKM
ncbi:TonB-dependent receptor [Salmonella enterica]|nr:TonB-dependent receptor [Salmonella enterica]